MVWRWVEAGLVLVLLAGCGGPSTPVDVALATPVDVALATPVDVALDPDGRPYDAPASWWDGHRTETRLMGPFQVAEGELRVMDGNALEGYPGFFADEAQSVSFGAIELLDLSIVWEIVPEEGIERETPLGVRLDVAGRQVETWEAFEYAYGTGGGVGGVTSAFVLAIDPGAENLLEPDYGKSVELFDLDDNGVDETLIFTNGFGDGGFPMTRGTSADGELASLMIWHTRYPWRLAVADGTPPPDVTSREGEMVECIEGRRAVDRDGFCLSDLEG